MQHAHKTKTTKMNTDYWVGRSLIYMIMPIGGNLRKNDMKLVGGKCLYCHCVLQMNMWPLVTEVLFVCSPTKSLRLQAESLCRSPIASLCYIWGYAYHIFLNTTRCRCELNIIYHLNKLQHHPWTSCFFFLLIYSKISNSKPIDRLLFDTYNI